MLEKNKLQKHVVIMVMHTLVHTQINTLLPELLTLDKFVRECKYD